MPAAMLSHGLAALIIVSAALSPVAPPAFAKPARTAAEEPRDEDARTATAETAPADREETAPPARPGQSTKVLTLAEKLCRQRHSCEMAGRCRPCER